MRSGILTVAIVTVLQVFWAVVIFATRDVPDTVSLSYFSSYNYMLMGFMLLAVSAAAVFGVLWPRPNVWTLVAVLPQQFVLFSGAIAALNAAASGHYADGVVRPWFFILLDQLPYVLLVVAHLIAVSLIYLQVIDDD